jgi:hypothetical protein
MISKLNSKRYKNKRKLSDSKIKTKRYNPYQEYDRKAKIYLQRISKLSLSETDQAIYISLSNLPQYNQSHLIQLFQLLRRYNAISLTEKI